jgi:hypothetical protein
MVQPLRGVAAWILATTNLSALAHPVLSSAIMGTASPPSKMQSGADKQRDVEGFELAREVKASLLARSNRSDTQLGSGFEPHLAASTRR